MLSREGCREKLGKPDRAQVMNKHSVSWDLLWVGGVLEAPVIQKRCSGRGPLSFSAGCCHKGRFYSVSQR